MIICEEAAYMDLGVFYEVVLPLLMVHGTAMIGISTPLSSFNFYSELTDLKDNNGRNVFNVVRAGMACDACRENGELQCPHSSSDAPWKSEERRATARAFYGPDKATLAKRELDGIVADDISLAFVTEHLRMFFKRPLTAEPHQPVSTVYMALDPNGGASAAGGSGSDTAIVTIFYDGANIVVCMVSVCGGTCVFLFFSLSFLCCSWCVLDFLRGIDADEVGATAAASVGGTADGGGGGTGSAGSSAAYS